MAESNVLIVSVSGVRGLIGQGLTADVAARLALQPDLPVVILPSGAADTQDLVALMDALAAGGAASVRIVRVEVQP